MGGELDGAKQVGPALRTEMRGLRSREPEPTPPLPADFGLPEAAQGPVSAQDQPQFSAPSAEASPHLTTEVVPVPVLPDASAPQLPAQAAAPHAPAMPAAQIAPVLVSLPTGPSQTQRLTVRLDPPELGQLDIRVDRSVAAAPKVEIRVERPETLALLIGDQPALHRALDQAGVPAEGRLLHLSLGGPGGEAQRDGTGRSAGSEHHTPSGRQRAAQADETKLPSTVPVTGRWLRAGLDITA